MKFVISLQGIFLILKKRYQKKFDRMVAWRDRRVVDVPIDEGIKTYKNVERKDSLVETALSLGIYLGDDI